MSAKKIAATVQPMEVRNVTTADGLTVEMEGVRVFVAADKAIAEAFATVSHRTTQPQGIKSVRQADKVTFGEAKMLDDASKSLKAAHTNLNLANECIESFLQQEW